MHPTLNTWLSTQSQESIKLRLRNLQTAMSLVGISGEGYRELLREYIELDAYYKKRFKQ